MPASASLPAHGRHPLALTAPSRFASGLLRTHPVQTTNFRTV
jgi:hypothetical protein